MDERCVHENAGLTLIKRGYGFEELVCRCGYILRRHVDEPLDMRVFGQLRTMLGDEPQASDSASDVPPTT